ncbi:MAG: bifunctional nuclease family protein [Alphaproteobacteria bacterium]|nr:bifunctional nuclease family protein [Alphaproteobacteria bacterium]
MYAVLLALIAPALAGPPKPPRASVEVIVEDVSPAGDEHVVFLTNAERTRVVPVQVGESEAIAVAFRLAERTPDRPLTHDLLETLATHLDARVEQVHIHSLEDGVFKARITFRARRRLVHLDARASDAIVLALGQKLPIYMAQEVYDASGVEVADLLRALERANAEAELL